MITTAAKREPLASQAKDLYLDLLKNCLTYSLWGETDGTQVAASGFFKRLLFQALEKRGFRLIRSTPAGQKPRAAGADWPALADTMIGRKRLDNLQFCVEDVLANGVPGDLIETGVWRGGATIFMRAILKAYGVTDRCVWVADSFAGLPPPDPQKYPADAGDLHHTFPALAVSLEQVQANFRRYGLLDEQVRFLKGWFRDTLPQAPVERLAVVRLDGDMYESTLDGLTHLYPKLSVGGYLIVDDYGVVPGSRQAIHDYREAHGIREEIRPIDESGVYWQRRVEANAR
jgi:O-methyltransferase